VGAQLFESPDNWELFKQLLGFPELTLIEAVARNKQVREIELLLEQSPIPPDPQELQAAQVQHAAATVAAQAMGGPPPPPLDPTSLLKPSVPIDELDFHQWEGKKGQEWLSGEEAWRQLALGNKAGVLNVKLHTKEHLKLAAAMAAPPMPMPAPHAGGPPHPGAAHAGEHGAPNAISAPPGGPGGMTM